jgi:hypothetical protein
MDHFKTTLSPTLNEKQNGVGIGVFVSDIN